MIEMEKDLQTLVKIGRFYGSVENALHWYSIKLMPTIKTNALVKSYASFVKDGDSYLIVVSSKNDELATKLIFGVISYSNNINQQVTNRFETETGIGLTNGPENIRKAISSLEKLFSTFENNPDNCKDIDVF